MKDSIKQQQVASLILKEFSVVLQQEGHLLYGSALVSVSRVRMSSDLGIAYMYISTYNTEDKETLMKVLRSQLAELRHSLAKRIGRKVRRIPNLKLFSDDTLDEVEHVDKLFAQLDTLYEDASTKGKEAEQQDKPEDEA